MGCILHAMRCDDLLIACSSASARFRASASTTLHNMRHATVYKRIFCLSMPKYAKEGKHLQKRARVCKNMQNYAKVCKIIYLFAKVCRVRYMKKGFQVCNYLKCTKDAKLCNSLDRLAKDTKSVQMDSRVRKSIQ